jgi:hypothetical protein
LIKIKGILGGTPVSPLPIVIPISFVSAQNDKQVRITKHSPSWGKCVRKQNRVLFGENVEVFFLSPPNRGKKKKNLPKLFLKGFTVVFLFFPKREQKQKKDQKNVSQKIYCCFSP